MHDLAAAIGLCLAIEGLLFAAFPQSAKRAMTAALDAPVGALRLVGLVSAVLGVAIVWLVRH